MSFTIQKASRQGIKPLIYLYAESGCGKTYSALLLARGIVGPTGKIVMGDTESGRGSLYADVLPGGYEVVEINEPFTPARMIEAMTFIESQGAAIGIIDSASHEWEGLGGVLAMASENEERSKKAGLHNWRTPKMEHAKFVLKLLQSPIPWIVCLRAKFKTRQIKNNGKTEIVKDHNASPIQADDFLFESTAHALILQNHTIVLTKCSHPDLKRCFPEDETTPLTSEHGKAIALWCSAPAVAAACKDVYGKPTSSPAKASQSTGGIVALKRELMALTQPHHEGHAGRLRTWLVDEMLIPDDLPLEELTESQLIATIAKVKTKLNL